MKLKPQIDLDKVKGLAENKNTKPIIKTALFALIVWVILFLLETILISGGLYWKGAPFVIVESIAIIVAMYFYMKKFTYSKKELMISLISFVLIYAILDFLAVNLLLQKLDFSIYKFWAYYIKFILILGIPYLWSRKSKIKDLNLNLPLTKKN